jgi:hypothetical protein
MYLSLHHVTVDQIDLSPELHHRQYGLEVIDLYALTDGVFLQFGDGYSVLLLANQRHQIVLLREMFPLILLFHMSVQHPHVDILTLGPFDALHEVVGSQLLQNLVQQVSGKLGAMPQILLRARVFLDDAVNPAIAVREDSVKDPVNALLLGVHQLYLIKEMRINDRPDLYCSQSFIGRITNRYHFRWGSTTTLPTIDPPLLNSSWK